MKIGFWLMLFSFLAGSALASVEQVKLYKSAFPDEKPKCGACHTSDKPKKDAHELNDYGKKAAAVKEAVDTASYQAVGKAPSE